MLLSVFTYSKLLLSNKFHFTNMFGHISHIYAQALITQVSLFLTIQGESTQIATFHFHVKMKKWRFLLTHPV